MIFFSRKKKTLLCAGSTTESFMLPPLPPTRLRLLCSILACFLPIRLRRSRQKSAEARFDSLLWQRRFSLSPALTWEVVKNVNGFQKHSVKKTPQCRKEWTQTCWGFVIVAPSLLCVTLQLFIPISPCGTHSDAHLDSHWQQVQLSSH